MELGLSGRRALITGVAGGIGAAVARALAAEGARVAGTDRPDAGVTHAAVMDAAVMDAAATDAAATDAAVTDAGVTDAAVTDAAVMDAAVTDAGVTDAGVTDVAGEASTLPLFFPADVTDQTQLDGAVESAVAALGGLDILVVCAGVSGPVGTPLADTSVDDWERVFAVNVTGAFLALRAAIPHLRAAGDASVVFIASDSALVGTGGMVPYCASKAAVLQLARASSVELDADGIRVNAVCPSIVDTPMSRGDLGVSGSFDEAGYPVQTADEVAAEVAFLCSRQARAINGTGLVSDFGFTARSGFPA